MDQDSGIASLPPQASGAQQPQAAASGVQSYIAPLTTMDMPRLLAEFNNPNSRFPKFAVLTAMQEKQKQAQMRQAAQNQAAMAQNAQQGQAPIAAGILAGAQQMAAPQYRYGGEVAFQSGGSAFTDPLLGGYTLQATPDAETAAEYERRKKQAREAEMTPFERLLRWVEGKRERPSKLRSAMYPDSAAQLTEATSEPSAAPSTKDTSNLFPFGPPESPMMPVPEVTVGAAPSQAPAQPRPPRAPAAPTAPSPAGVSPESALETAVNLANRSRLEGAVVTPEVTAARGAESKLMQENLAAALEEAKSAREAAEKRRASKTEAASRSIMEDPEALFRLAGAMDTRRGQGIRSLAGAAGEELGRRRMAIEAAEEKFAGEQKELRALDAANRQYNLSIVQLQRAYAEGDAEKIRVAKQAVADSGIELQKAKMDYGLKSREAAAKEMTAQASMLAATRPASEVQLAQYATTPEGQKGIRALQDTKRNPYDTINDNAQKMLDAWLKSQPVPPSTAAVNEYFRNAVKVQAELARNMGISVPEAVLKQGETASGASQLKYNPATGKIE